MKRAYLQQKSQYVEVGYEPVSGCLVVSFITGTLGKDDKIIHLGDFSLEEFLVEEKVPLEVLEEAISRAQGIDGYPETTLDGLPADSPKRQTEIEDLIQTGEPPTDEDGTENGHKSNLEVI